MRGLVQMFVKSHILPREQLGSKNNLPGMFTKVLDGSINPLQYRDTILLRLYRFHQPLRLNRFQHGNSIGDSALQPSKQFSRVDLAPRGELRVPRARIGLAADAGDNPLPQIPSDMEQQVAYGILMIAVPHPDLPLIEPAHALPDTGKELLELTNRIIHEDAFNGWLHKASVKRTRRPRQASGS